MTSFVIQRLHTFFCEESEADFAKMRKILSEDHSALERLCVSRIYDDNTITYYTPIIIAVECGHLKCVKFFLQMGASLSPQGTNGVDAFNTAIRYEHYDILEYLVGLGFGPNHINIHEKENHDRCEYLHQAVTFGSTQLVQFLLDRGAITEDKNYIIQRVHNEDNLTPAVTAINAFRHDNLKILLLNSAIMDFETETNIHMGNNLLDSLSLPLQLVLSFTSDIEKKLNILYILHQFGANFSKKTKFGPSPLAISQCNILRYEARSFLGLDRRRPRCRDMEDEDQKRFSQEINLLSSIPLSLKALCRLAIRKYVCQKYITSCHKLPDLPHELRDYLLFKTNS